MNNKGMTTIELITSFILASVVFILLFNVILSLKDIYITNQLSTRLLINQANLSRSLNKEINSHKDIISISKTSESEYMIVYNDGINKVLNINDQEISFDGYTYKLDENTKLEPKDKYVYIKPLSTSNLLVIDLPISNDTIEGDFGVKIIYKYDPSLVNITLE